MHWVPSKGLLWGQSRGVSTEWSGGEWIGKGWMVALIRDIGADAEGGEMAMGWVEDEILAGQGEVTEEGAGPGVSGSAS